MVKKLRKYVKIAICCAIIFSLLSPSYAALSASDGSAFVTKAEFDSALADFNARLTTFEAGINSKIDSQVTSYLDRNGIWSGKEQPPYKSEEKSLNDINSSIQNYVNGTLYNHKNDETIIYNSALVKPNKTGLAYLCLNWNTNWAMGWMSNDVNHKMAEGSFNDVSRIEDKNGACITNIRMWNVYWSATADYVPMVELSGNSAMQTYLFFVNKDMEYYFKSGLKFDGRISATGTWTNWGNADNYATTYGTAGDSSTSTTSKIWFEGTMKVY